MDNTKSKLTRKSARKPQRFQVDPLAELAMPELDRGPFENRPRFELAEDPEVSLDQRIEILSLEDIQPDPWNPRHILPTDTRFEHISGKIDARGAVQRWIKAGEKNAAVADQLQQYRMMGTSLLKQGQINPITVAKHFCEDGSFVWRIESGERRYWSKWLMVFEGHTDDRTIHAIIRDELNPTRQAVENLQNESLTAVGEARQVARLFLDRLRISPESDIAREYAPGSDAYFRLALRPTKELLSGRKKLPNGFWPALEEIMGNKRQHLERKLHILKLPDEVLPMVDTHQLTERQMREIIAMPEELWQRLIVDTIEYELTGPELAHIAPGDEYVETLQMILSRRLERASRNGGTTEAKLNRKDTSKAKSEKHIVYKRVVTMAKYLNSTISALGNDWPLDAIVENLVATGDHQVVLANVDELEKLIHRLKSRVADIP